MSDTTDPNGFGPLRAANTNATLAPKSVLPSAADLDAFTAEQNAARATAGAPDVSNTPASADAPAVVESQDTISDTISDEDIFDVSRAEFSELQDAFLSIAARLDKYNLGAPHKI